MSNQKLVLIGGSAGSFRPVCRILGDIHAPMPFTLVLVLHRLRSVNAGFDEALAVAARNKKVLEPFDKDIVVPGNIYLAPANYHLMFENKNRFALSNDEVVQFSRPSIDLALASSASVFGSSLTCIILSGANRDGVAGAMAAHRAGAKLIVQDPGEAEIQTMPAETLRHVPSAMVMRTEEIIHYLNTSGLP